MNKYELVELLKEGLEIDISNEDGNCGTYKKIEISLFDVTLATEYFDHEDY